MVNEPPTASHRFPHRYQVNPTTVEHLLQYVRTPYFDGREGGLRVGYWAKPQGQAAESPAEILLARQGESSKQTGGF